MNFRFGLQNVLRHRKILRDEAQRDYQEAQFKVNQVLDQIRIMYNEIDNARKSIHELHLQGGNFATQVVQIEGFIEGTKLRIEIEKKKARELMMIADEKQQVLSQKSQEFKMIEKLREKKVEEFKIANRKKEAKELDDLVSTRVKRKDFL